MKTTLHFFRPEKRGYDFLLYLFPVIYLLMGFYFRQIFGDLSLRSIDPEYIHFISGLSVSMGKFSNANIDQPASVLHLLLALIFRTVYFFREHNLPYFQDVIYHADLYLAVANLTITTIISFVLFRTGKAAFRITGNIVFALALQTSPFLLNIWYDLTGRIYSELLFILPAAMLQILLLREIYGPAYTEKRRIFLYALAVAVGLSLKMTFLPWLLLPLFLLRNVKQKLKYLLFTILFFLALSPPVLFQLNRFRQWMISLFLHSGTYESGAKTIINFPLFFKNLELLFTQTTTLFYALFVLVFLLIMAFFRNIKATEKRIGWGLVVSITFVVFITAKHFEMRYFISALLFFPFLLVLNVEIISEFFHQKVFRYVFVLLIPLVIGYKLKQEIPYMRIVSQSVEKQVSAREETRKAAGMLTKNSYKIIVSQDYGCPFPSYAIMYSFSMGGKSLPHYKEKLNALYPDVYQYFTWDNSIRYWGKKFDPDTVVRSNKPVYLYLQKNSKTLYRRTLQKFFGDTMPFTIRKKLLFENPENKEAILQLYFSKIKPADTDRKAPKR